jgi:hypothetical protein
MTSSNAPSPEQRALREASHAFNDLARYLDAQGLESMAEGARKQAKAARAALDAAGLAYQEAPSGTRVEIVKLRELAAGDVFWDAPVEEWVTVKRIDVDGIEARVNGDTARLFVGLKDALVPRCLAAASPSSGAITHGRHCVCSACAAQDWTDPKLAACGMHGPSCPPVYAPMGRAGSVAREAPPNDRQVKPNLGVGAREASPHRNRLVVRRTDDGLQVNFEDRAEASPHAAEDVAERVKTILASYQTSIAFAAPEMVPVHQGALVSSLVALVEESSAPRDPGVPAARYIPNGEGGGNERCEHCMERASAHLCRQAPGVLDPKAREHVEEMLPYMESHPRSHAKRIAEQARAYLSTVDAAKEKP